LDDYQEGEAFFIVMEFVEGGNLRKLLEKYKDEGKTIPEDLLIFIFSQLISALKYCYDNNIIHGDIKSENIIQYSQALARKIIREKWSQKNNFTAEEISIKRINDLSGKKMLSEKSFQKND
jgi:serine/threonine protein kinase